MRTALAGRIRLSEKPSGTGSSRTCLPPSLFTAVPVYPVTSSLALRAGEIDGESQAKGIRVPLADLLIAVTALELGFKLGTLNLRHFQQVPGLDLVRL